MFYVDIDECTTGMNDCDMDAFCNNTEGGFFCTCNEGFDGSGTIGDCDGQLYMLICMFLCTFVRSAIKDIITRAIIWHLQILMSVPYSQVPVI